VQTGRMQANAFCNPAKADVFCGRDARGGGRIICPSCKAEVHKQMLTHEKRRGTVTVRLDGDLDHHTAAGIREELDRLIADPAVTRLIFDLSGLGFMDSSGIGMMLGRYKLMARRGGSVAVKSGGSQVDRMMELSGLYRIMEKLA